MRLSFLVISPLPSYKCYRQDSYSSSLLESSWYPRLAKTQHNRATDLLSPLFKAFSLQYVRSSQLQEVMIYNLHHLSVYFHTSFITCMCCKQAVLCLLGHRDAWLLILCFPPLGAVERNSYFLQAQHCTAYHLQSEKSNCARVKLLLSHLFKALPNSIT